MGNFYDEFNATFWLSLATMMLGSFGICLRYAYMSKCEDIVLCFGLLNIHRNINAEVEIEEQNNINNNTEENNI